MFSIIFIGILVVVLVASFLIKCEIDNRKRAELEIELVRMEYQGYSFDKDIVERREEELKRTHGRYYYPPYEPKN